MSLASGEISEGHARAILGAPSEEQQIRLWERVRERNLTVRQAESAAQQLRTLDGSARPPRAASPPGDRLAVERLQSAL
ncbi:MAG: chromosome partitioning protein ParB, partial [Gammaproteobacteria bacterium]|nr:chromosome partitioning protein ParB [Gammaproteobacteria bacterium]